MNVPSTEPEPDAAEAAATERRVARSSAGGRTAMLRRLAVHFGVVSVAAGAIGCVMAGASGGRSAVLGVALAGGNLLLMRRITSGLTHASGGAAAWALALPFKLVALVAVAYGLVHSGVAQPVPLAIGFALLPVSGVFLLRAASVPPPDLTGAARRTHIPGSAGPSHIPGSAGSTHRNAQCPNIPVS